LDFEQGHIERLVQGRPTDTVLRAVAVVAFHALGGEARLGRQNSSRFPVVYNDARATRLVRSLDFDDVLEFG